MLSLGNFLIVAVGALAGMDWHYRNVGSAMFETVFVAVLLTIKMCGGAV